MESITELRQPLQGFIVCGGWSNFNPLSISINHFWVCLFRATNNWADTFHLSNFRQSARGGRRFCISFFLSSFIPSFLVFFLSSSLSGLSAMSILPEFLGLGGADADPHHVARGLGGAALCLGGLGAGRRDGMN